MTEAAAPAPGMRPRAGQLALGQTRGVLLWKMVEYAGLVSFTVAAPRLMGPERYGSFAALLALVGLMTIVTGLGGQAAFGRFMPEYEADGQHDRVRGLFTQFLITRIGVSSVLGAALVVFLPRLLPEASRLVGILGAAALIFGVIALTCYQLFYGLNRLTRWLARDASVKLLLVTFLIILGGIQTLERAALAMVVTEVTLILLAARWVRDHLADTGGRGGRWEGFESHLRFGLLFFGANVLLMAIWRGGEIMVLLFTESRAEVGFFNIASAAAMAFGALIGQFSAMLMPSITSIHVSGDQRRVEAWLGYSLKYLTIATVVFLITVDAVGEWAVGLVLGAEYLPVVPSLKVLALGLLPVALVRTTVTMAIVEKKPPKALFVAGSGLITFLVAAAILVPGRGAVGAAASVAIAVGLAGAIAFRIFALGPVLAVARFWRVLFPAVPALMLTLIDGVPPLLLGVLSLGAYALLLVLGRAVSPDEMRRLVGVLRG